MKQKAAMVINNLICTCSHNITTKIPRPVCVWSWPLLIGHFGFAIAKKVLPLRAGSMSLSCIMSCLRGRWLGGRFAFWRRRLGGRFAFCHIEIC